jgi:phosphatidylinositol-3-phosphatase
LPVLLKAIVGRTSWIAVGLLALLGLTPSTTSPAANPPVPRFTHVVVVVFENKERGEIVGSSEAPTFGELTRRYAAMTRYDAVAHPSLPNYLALVSGSTHGITTDCTACAVSGRSLADTLTGAGRSWKTYAEGLPRAGYTGAEDGAYAKKHDPFLYFRNVLARPSWMQRVVPFREFGHDARAGQLPDFALIVPNLCDDMHDCPVATGDRWLRKTVVPLLSSPSLAGGVVFVVFDEGTTGIGGGGNIDALALGPLVRPGARFTRPTSHYGLLRTIEQAWGLPLLGRSATVQPITGIWR